MIPADKAVVRMEKSKPYTPDVDGFFVPGARMQEILHALSAEIEKQEQK